MAKTLYELYLDNMKKAGTQKASQPAALPAIKMPTLEAPKTTPATVSATGVKMPAVGAKNPSGVDMVRAVTQKSAAQGGGRATMPQVKKQETATDRLANIRAFGAGDYSGGAQLLEKAYKTARGAVKGIGSSYANIGGSAVEGMGNLQETMQKGEYDKKVQQMKDNKAFYEQALKSGINPRTGKKLTVDEKSRYYKILNTQYTDSKISQMENIYKDATVSQKARTMEAANDAFAASDRLKASADKDVAAAKEGSGKVGQFLVDLGYTGTQLLADTAANAIAPGAGMVSMASRVYGDASAEARREGKTASQQVLSGLKGATIEVLTEKLFGGLAKAYGAGTADELVEKMADKLTRTAAGKRVATWLINSGGEGIEEVVSDLLNPLADRALGLDDGKSPIYTTDDVAQMGYDFLLGTAMGAIGGAGHLRGTQSAPAAQETQPVQMPTLVDANGRTAAQRQAWEQLSEPQRAQLDEADKIARRFGVRVELDNREGVSGSYRDGVITLNPNTANPVRQTLIHELTHYMESSGLYSRFSDTAMRYVAENMGADVESVRQAVMVDYARSGVALDKDGATREIVAKFAEEKLFTDESTVRRLLAEDRNLFQGIYDWIRDALNKLTGTGEEAYLRNAEKLYAKALRETTAETGRGTQYSFEQQPIPTWEQLGAKPDMHVVDIRESGLKLPYAVERNRILNSAEIQSIYRNPPVNIDTGELIFVTPATLTHSFSNSGENSIYATKHLREILENAVLTYAEPSRKADDNSTGVYTLFGAVQTETGIQPVKIKVKEYRIGSSVPKQTIADYFAKEGVVDPYAYAYDERVLALESIEKEEPSSSATANTEQSPPLSHPSSSSTIRVQDLLRLVNSEYQKYVPEMANANINTEQYSTGRGLEEIQRDGVQMPVIGNAPATTRDGNIFQPGNSDAAPAGNMTWRDVYGISERGEPVDTGGERLTAEDSAELSDYLDALAQDENAFTDDPYTVSDAVYDAKLRRLTGEEAPPETRTEEQVTQEDLDELASLFADIADPIDADKNAMTADMVSNESVPQKQSKREAVRSAWDFFYRKMVDAGHSVTKLSEAVGDPYLYQFYNQARASSSAGVNMITGAQTNTRGQKVGASLNDVFSPIRAKGDGYYHDFQLYMYDLHNIDRMSLSRNKEVRVLEARAALRDFDANNPDIRTDTAAQLHRMTEDPDPDIAALAREKERLIRELDRAEAIKDKPVFDYEFTAEDSRARAERLLRQHPEFAEYQAQVRKYIDNMMQYRVESGLITQEDADFLKQFYPNYVPTMRVQEKGTAGAGRDLNTVRVGKTVGRAQGGTERLLPLHEALGKQTMKVVREGSKNRFADRLLHDYIQAGDTVQVNRYIKEASRYEHDFNPDSLDDVSVERPTKDKTVTAYVNGTLWEMTVDDTLFDAVKALSPDTTESNAVTKVIRASNNLFKSLVTGYNPTFLARNVIRDLQTAGLNTRDAAAFARNYPRALAEIRNNGEYWQLYKALGGVYSSVFDYTTGTVKEPKGAMGKFMARVEALNMAAEQAPRLAEFMGVMQNAERASARGEAVNDLATAADALYAAADITVNFGRAGSLGKVLNANYVPFLNPGVQGLDKLIRRVTETRGAKEWAKLAMRAAALGIAPSLLNALLYHDDDEWEDLRDSDKDTNYMFKLGNGYWLKIPKGRELSVFGIAADRVYDALRGEDVDVLSTVNTVGSQVAPANPLTSNIFSALVDSQLLNPDSPGRTWYGGDIESQRLQNYAPGERYDSGTDIFSKTVGQALGISPKKLNYVLDQYSGVVGDFLLPILTPQAERGMFEKAFTVDAMSSNRVSGDFYDKANELKYAKNAGDVASGVVSRWWNKQQTACSDLWKQIREVEASTELSNSEKKQQTRELKAIVTGIQKNTIAQEDVFRSAVKSHLAAGEDEDTAYREANKDCFGAEYALQVYNKDVYQRAQDAKQNGVSYDDFYTYYFGTKDIKATTTESAVSRRFQFLRASGMSEHTQAEIYFADMASDKTLTSLANLEVNAGVSAEDYYLYKAASAGMSKKVEKLQAINSLKLTAAQKDALYYSEGWAESKLYEAPWHGGQTAAVRMPVVKTTGGAPVFVRVAQSAPTVQMPVVRTAAKAPVYVRVTQNAPKAVRVVKIPVVK